MVSPDQQKMLDVLEKQRLHQLRVDRVLKIVLPIVGFLLSVMCANLNRLSLIFTIVISITALWMVGIKRQALWIWTTVVALYCVLDNFYSFGSFDLKRYLYQFGSITTFIWIMGIGRPYIDRWLMKD
ncbi:hypothetical protein [Acinetobacter terrestris]|jgi:hypothetical protein|uniref:Histidine kinase n=1 Tax=Acinetobacter terrestris TaxID=2529843 RepID=A0AAW6UV02_9GAMM|nr:hypothetical protein [Acinetobacter terrestris]MDK1685006.1 hypothetical protein [Acinetobacter terrestris]NNH34307.1 hypothetical protein [Acinetobacter terrestris]